MSSRSLVVAMEDAFRSHPIVKLLGLRLLAVTRKRVEAEMPITASHLNRGGRVAGGVIMAFADVLGARGTVANLPPGARTTTIESKTNFFAPGEGPALNATARPLHIGRTTMVWQTTIRNPDGRLVAVVTQTQIVLPPVRPGSQEVATSAGKTARDGGALRSLQAPKEAATRGNGKRLRPAAVRDSAAKPRSSAAAPGRGPAARRRAGAGAGR